MSKKKELEPLQSLLDSMVSRLDVLEAKVGITPASAPSASKKTPVRPTTPPPPPPAVTADASPAVQAYDEFLKTSVTPLVDACDALEMQNMGSLLQDAWTSIRTVVVIASRAKLPADPATELQVHLKDTQTAIGSINALRLDRTFDHHYKAIQESCGSLSWILIRPAPVPFVKESIGSTEFWSNRVRKQYKGVDEKHIAFCNSLDKALKDLTTYVTEYHKTGLTFNNKNGVSLAEAAIVATSEPEAPVMPVSPGRPFVTKVGGGSMSSLVAELESKRTSDGSSAATGLRHVKKDQQTWRKEFKGDKKSTISMEPKPKKAVAQKKTKLTGLPICEYQDRGHKWVVENQTKETAPKVLQVEVSDPKQQVYMFNCDHVTVQILGGKFKSVILDRCQNCSVIFETVISACEVVHCKKIEIQTTGVCPSFSIDQTDGCLVYLSKESLAVTNFVTAKSTEMNVSFPDGDEQKEVPIPEQFVHKLVGGAVTSEVSDVYH